MPYLTNQYQRGITVKSPKLRLKPQALCIFLALAWAGTAAAQSAEEDELALTYGDKSFVSIATGSQQAISRAPAVATVITAQDIEAMGATELEQVLESVPGLHVSMSSLAGNAIYSFRGIFTGFNPQVLMLVNGIPITNVFAGNRGQIWGGMPLENVARIEVIRGPGSALYGADAFSGVINVITKAAADIKGTEYGIRVGSFNSRDAWIQHGGNLGPLEAAFYLRAGKTEGQHGVIQQDQQSSLDRLFSTHASLAPGSISAARYALDARADLSYSQWRLRGGYQQREVGAGAGLAESLDQNGRAPSSRLYLDLTYQNANWAPNWDLSAVAGYYDIKENPGNRNYTLFPAGAFGGAFPDGMIGNPGHSERHSHVSLSAFYTGFERHRLRLGTGYRIEDLYATTETKNYQLITGGIPQPLGSIVDVSGTPDVYLTPHKRNLAYLFLQDEWTIAKDWTLTAGVRHDRYSDFGQTTNPRLALVWDAAYNLVIKAMHGQAFRAPSFSEQYTINNPVSIGNPALRPETIATSELAFSWQPSQGLQTNLSLFHYRMRDIIRFVPDATGATAQNSGGQSGHGLELDASWDATRNLRLAGSFSLQHSTDNATGKDAGLAPHRRLFVRADWRFAPLWQLGTTINHVADRKRQPDDSRPPVADYSTLDLSLRREKFAGNWEVRATVLNLFNRDAREPSLSPGNIPFDLPLPGRAIYVQFQHSL
jgi:outer membrane receptor for ferrienterochelin and colicins